MARPAASWYPADGCSRNRSGEEEAMRVSIRDLVGDFPGTLDQGQMVYDKIAPAIAERESVELDFDGISVAGAPFLNSAIGQLFKDHERDTLDRLFVFRNVNPVVQPTLRLVMKHSEEYFSSEMVRAAVDHALRNLAEEV